MVPVVDVVVDYVVTTATDGCCCKSVVVVVVAAVAWRQSFVNYLVRPDD